MNDERTCVTHIGQMREELQVLHERQACVIAALQAEGEDSAATARAVFLREVVIAVALEAGIADPFHSRMVSQELRNSERIF